MTDKINILKGIIQSKESNKGNDTDNKKSCGLWHSWKNVFLQFFEGMMTLFYLVGKSTLGWCSFVF